MQFITYLTTPYTQPKSELFWHSLSGGQVSDGYQGQPWYFNANRSKYCSQYDVYETAEEAIEADSLN